MRAVALGAATALLALAGCGGDDSGEATDEAANSLANFTEALPEGKERPPLPGLLPVARDELQGVLQGSPLCDFGAGDDLLFVAAADGAVARVNGRIVRFAAEAPAGPTGGFFRAGRFSISIGRISEVGVPSGPTMSWPARLILTDRAEDHSVIRRVGAWRCAG